MQRFALILFLFLFSTLSATAVQTGADQLFKEPYLSKLKGKKIGLVTNQTAVNSKMQLTRDLLKNNAKNYKVVAFFAPEHGLLGQAHASDHIADTKDEDGIPIFSLYGKTRRPTEAMLKGIDLLIFDIQDIGSRSYTYITTLFYVMEEAAKKKIPVMVLDRPNPINGLTIDGPMLEPEIRSMVGYINVPYCHGLTIGELARYFNGEYKIGCQLDVIPMKGWSRSMTFKDTRLPWVPTSPHIPESDSPLYYPITGIMGELSLVNIGVGYTMPFKVVGAPWIEALSFSKALNEQHYPGVLFRPIYFKPFYGKYKDEHCQGVQIVVTDPLAYKPVAIQYLLFGILKRMYAEPFKEALKKSESKRKMFAKVNGTDKVWEMINGSKPFIWELRGLDLLARKEFAEKRKPYLIADYTVSTKVVQKK